MITWVMITGVDLSFYISLRLSLLGIKETV